LKAREAAATPDRLLPRQSERRTFFLSPLIARPSQCCPAVWVPSPFRKDWISHTPVSPLLTFIQVRCHRLFFSRRLSPPPLPDIWTGFGLSFNCYAGFFLPRRWVFLASTVFDLSPPPWSIGKPGPTLQVSPHFPSRPHAPLWRCIGLLPLPGIAIFPPVYWSFFTTFSFICRPCWSTPHIIFLLPLGEAANRTETFLCRGSAREFFFESSKASFSKFLDDCPSWCSSHEQAVFVAKRREVGHFLTGPVPSPPSVLFFVSYKNVNQ